MDDNFSSRVKDVITYSKEEALRLGHDFIGTEHLLLGMLRDGGGKAINILNSLEIDLDYLRKKVEILSPPNPINDFNQNHNTLLKEFNSYLWRKNIHSKFEGSKGLFKAIPLAVDSDGKLKIHNLDKVIEESIDLSQARMLYLDAKESS